jgi:hypothetical protein
MKSWLLLTIRILVVAFVVSTMGFVCAKPLMPVRTALAPNLDVNQPAEPTQPGWIDKVSEINAVPLFVCVFGLATGGGVLFWQRVRRSKRAFNQALEQGEVLTQPEFLFDWMTYLHSKVTIDLTGSQVADANFPKVDSIRGLVCLRVPNNELTNESCCRIARCSTLERLDLSNTKINDDGLAKLSKLAELKMLKIENTDVGLDSVEDLLSKVLLDWIDLTGTRLSPEEVSELQEQYPKTTIEFQT